jgi:hypothetical protein
MRQMKRLLVAAVAAAWTVSAAGQTTRPGADPVGRPQAKLVLGAAAPELLATTPDGKPVALAGLRGGTAAEGEPAAPAKMIVLQFGSLTEPAFRAHASAVERLAARYADKAKFVIVYQQEAHAADTDTALQINADQGFAVAQPVNLAERQQLALQAVERLKIKNQTVVVDAWNNTSALRYGSYPNMTFVIDAKGNLQAGYPWMDTGKVQAALDALAAGKPLPAELRGSVKPSAPGGLDAPGAAMDMTGGRGPAAVALALDRIDLTDGQRQMLYPALAQFLADLQNFRQSRGVGPARGGQANAAKEEPKEDPQQALKDLRASAEKLKTVIKGTVNEKDAATLFAALEQMQAQRFFANP